jgi:enoyl-[acyl-carrier protein] reductase III
LKHFPERERMLEDARRTTPVGRLATPEDVAAAAEMLISEDASMITGHTLVIDGGRSLLA